MRLTISAKFSYSRKFLLIILFINILLIGKCSCDLSLAKNVSRLLDKLLTNYSKSLRPTHNLGSPTLVEINLRINSLGPISDLEMVI
jgi:hypothetical protein